MYRQTVDYNDGIVYCRQRVYRINDARVTQSWRARYEPIISLDYVYMSMSATGLRRQRHRSTAGAYPWVYEGIYTRIYTPPRPKNCQNWTWQLKQNMLLI